MKIAMLEAWSFPPCNWFGMIGSQKTRTIVHACTDGLQVLERCILACALVRDRSFR